MRGQYHHGDLRAAFLEVALQSLDADGELPSWRALARACEVSHTAPYRHFANFDALQTAVATACFERLTATIHAAVRDHTAPTERLAAGLRAYVEFGLAHRSWYDLMFGRSLVLLRDPAVQSAGTAAYMTLIDAVAACGVKDVASVGFTLWCAVHGFAELAACGLQPPVPIAAPERTLDQLIAMCITHTLAAVPRPTPKRGGAGKNKLPGRSTLR